MQLLHAKVIAVIALGLGTIIFGLMPLCFIRQGGRSQWPLLTSSLLCFGGGVLLSTSVVHILSELRESIPEYQEYAEIIFCIGFFLLYMIDEIVHYVYGSSHELNVTNDNHHNHNHRTSFSSPKYTYGATERDPLIYGERQAPYNPEFYRASSDSDLCEENPPSQLCHVGHQEPCTAVPTVNVGLLVALSVHSALEGLVIGLESLPSKVILMLGAVASHKLVVGFCLGMELTSSRQVKLCRHFIYIFIFTLGSVGGILIGMVVSNIPKNITLYVIPVLQGIAGGTLLYVTVSEVLPRERARWHQQHIHKAAGVCQFLSVGVGFILMTVVTKYLDNDK